MSIGGKRKREIWAAGEAPARLSGQVTFRPDASTAVVGVDQEVDAVLGAKAPQRLIDRLGCAPSRAAEHIAAPRAAALSDPGRDRRRGRCSELLRRAEAPSDDGHPLVAPVVIPWMKRRCIKMYMIRTGTAMMRPAAAIVPGSPPRRRPAQNDRASGAVWAASFRSPGQVGQRGSHQEVVL